MIVRENCMESTFIKMYNSQPDENLEICSVSFLATL
uniref:Uncharacterized protein n=1 Tax=Anguilla anguilla TaxID=7936 RepID=A0A0E9Q0L9_ANGAN